MRHRGRDQIDIAADQQRNARRRGDLHELDRHADARRDLAHDVDVEAGRLVLVVEKAERRRVELHAGEQLAALLDLRDRALLRGGWEDHRDQCE
jgi:hypothetical protein